MISDSKLGDAEPETAGTPDDGAERELPQGDGAGQPDFAAMSEWFRPLQFEPRVDIIERDEAIVLQVYRMTGMCLAPTAVSPPAAMP